MIKFARSPHFWALFNVGLQKSAKLEIEIGGINRYTIVKNFDTTGHILIEYAELIRDYINIEYEKTGSNFTTTSWSTEVTLIKTIYDGLNATGAVSVTSTDVDTFSDGYGYFEELAPETDKGLLQTNNIVYNTVPIPYNKAVVSQIDYFAKDVNVVSKVKTITSGIGVDSLPNELIPSTDLSTWVSDGNSSVTSGVLDPQGKNNAYRIDFTVANSYRTTTGMFDAIEGGVCYASVWIKGSGSITLLVQEVPGDYTSYFQKNITVNNSWRKYVLSGVNLDDGNPPRFTIRKNDTSSIDVFLPSFKNDYSEFDRVVLTASSGNEEVTIVNVNECKYDPVKLDFVNKFGAIQEVWFFKKSVETLRTEKKSFNRSTISNSGTYNNLEHTKRDFNITSNKSLKINSGYVDESFSDIMQEILQSEQVWVTVENVTLPVNVKTSSLTFKTRLNDKLIEFSLDVEFSFNAINNIR